MNLLEKRMKKIIIIVWVGMTILTSMRVMMTSSMVMPDTCPTLLVMGPPV
jgi:hypothetical protein